MGLQVCNIPVTNDMSSFGAVQFSRMLRIVGLGAYRNGMQVVSGMPTATRGDSEIPVYHKVASISRRASNSRWVTLRRQSCLIVVQSMAYRHQ